ncbi:FAD-binding oxidoreductase [Mesorhizobium sp.]|uniref:NAD(P)/FAD-dependent oxidoreductase n=1 Tax=Mesorhizobium sp. TaxID=1871066 RepID=UPI000FE7656F|nr:FAD-binding oxidoreductase [Mesorhizobium sp.]RWB66304.1 MAG: FAD-binding oxidoreductase [Mesorhizobium sp.]
MKRGSTTDIAIVGAGFVGLAVAWALSLKDPNLRITIFDEGDFASGGAGRNGSGYRLQWSRDFNIHLAKDSLEVFENCESLLDYAGGVELRQIGYLILAHSPEAMEVLKQSVETQRRFGVPSEILTPSECNGIQPGLRLDGLQGGSFCWMDGTASPFKWLDALNRAVLRAGAVVHWRRKVTGITPRNGTYRVSLADGEINAAKVVICTDWALPELLEPLGIDLPIAREMKGALITEAFGRVVNTVLMAKRSGIGIKQLDRGNVIITRSRGDNFKDYEANAWRNWLTGCASAATELLPALRDVAVLRQWDGYISLTPDMQPAFGETEIKGVYAVVSAYKGFMLSPQLGRIMADIVTDGSSDHIAASPLALSRFKSGKLVPEALTI